MDNIKQEQYQNLEAMFQHEKIIGELYREFSIQLPEKKDFWQNLWQEEERHAQWINDLIKKLKEDKIYVDHRRFRVQAIKVSMEYIGSLIEKAKKGEMNLRQQLAAALDLEKALIEKKFLEVIETDSSGLKNLLNNLKKETQGHFDKIEKELEKIK